MRGRRTGAAVAKVMVRTPSLMHEPALPHVVELGGVIGHGQVSDSARIPGRRQRLRTASRVPMGAAVPGDSNVGAVVVDRPGEVERAVAGQFDGRAGNRAVAILPEQGPSQGPGSSPDNLIRRWPVSFELT